MGSIQVDDYLISIGEFFKCPKCSVLKKTQEFLERHPSGIFKTADIVCTACFIENKNYDEKSLKKKCSPRK